VNDTHLPSFLSESGVLRGREEPLDGRWGGLKVVGGWRLVRESKHLENTGCRIVKLPWALLLDVSNLGVARVLVEVVV